MKEINESQEIKKKSTSKIIGDIEKNDSHSFDLSIYKYSSLGATIQRKQIETGKKFIQKKIENNLVVTRIA